MISNKRQEVIKNAHNWIATPYQHQAGIRKQGVDCAMLIACVALESGLVTKQEFKKIPPYPSDWHLHRDNPILLDVLQSFGCKEKNKNKLYPGDILVFKLGRTASHLGIYTGENYFIHAYGGGVGKVTKNSLTGKWEKRLFGLYKFPRIG